MMPAIIVAVYLCVVLYIGIFAFSKGTGSRDPRIVRAVRRPCLRHRRHAY